MLNDKADPNKNQVDEVVRLMSDRIIGAGSVTFKGESLKNHVAVLLKYKRMTEDIQSAINVCGGIEGTNKLVNFLQETLDFDPLKNHG